MSSEQRIWLIRHAQGFHNVAEDYSLLDPALTPLGIKQASILRTEPRMQELRSSVQVIVSSPLRRTLQTALGSLEDVLQERAIPFEIIPEFQECNDLPCDTPDDLNKLRGEFEHRGNGLSFEHCKPGFNSKRGAFAASQEALDARAAWARRYLRSLDQETVAVFCHADFLRHMLPNDSPQWENTECRIVRYTGAALTDNEAHFTVVDTIKPTPAKLQDTDERAKTSGQ
ncbi:uncharacterized protein L969DRAFT_93657 [Mixia osmundae IAM 14324]|uniref:Phosphoglycerate mutase-like protein n=1 Tax=Mixia osmundae (strain CBS 9802 / IAM 14324 / JCM 22182 / KY 12970) TaxID=764103 RepID=G7E976_MIXOS|nr:uncharacterized protein L969DRAFT_93657 [Mixia osmundae IAM 14324]KEI39817.1 hypothetical protein L969DRAFT_93657 [Mixia osmundae IAM 14324]GAA99195.1 hypothetical protein E5Q_05887 [Mixia osmundae IAM 14324]